MKPKERISFSHEYKKLAKNVFTTVRWTDKHFRLGSVVEIDLVDKKTFGLRAQLGQARIIKLELKKIKDLDEKFCKKDADCDWSGFMLLMAGFYQKKLDWKQEDSEIQIITLERLKVKSNA